VGFIVVLNFSIFYTNLRWMLNSAESMAGLYEVNPADHTA
jgi:hypothetical protein